MGESRLYRRIFVAVGVKVGASVVGYAIENATRVAEESAKKIAVNHGTDVAIWSEQRWQAELDENSVGHGRLQPFQAEWRAELAEAKPERVAQVKAQVGILKHRGSAAKIRVD